MSSWIETTRGLFQTLSFENLKELNHFIEQLDAISEQMNHHADIIYVTQEQIDVYVLTHDEGKITRKDYQLTREISNIYKQVTELKSQFLRMS